MNIGSCTPLIFILVVVVRCVASLCLHSHGSRTDNPVVGHDLLLAAAERLPVGLGATECANRVHAEGVALARGVDATRTSAGAVLTAIAAA